MCHYCMRRWVKKWGSLAKEPPVLRWAVVVQLLSHIWLFAGFPVLHCLLELLKLMSIKSMMLSNHLILCGPLLLPPWIFSSIRVLFGLVSISDFLSLLHFSSLIQNKKGEGQTKWTGTNISKGNTVITYRSSILHHGLPVAVHSLTESNGA